MKSKILLFAVLLSITFFMGCNNEPVNESATSNSITTDETIVNSEIDATVDDLSIIAEDQFDMQKSSAAKTSAGMKSMLPPCAIVTAVLTNETWTRTIDFGTQGCAMPNGNILKGKIIISFSKNFTTPIRTISYKLEGFYHNDKLIEGSKTITHELKTSNLLATVHPVTTHSIDVKITYPDGKIYSRVGTRVREMVEGFATMTNWEDNVFNVWGNHITTFPNGSVYTCTIKTPLLIKMSCKMPFPVSGVVEIVKNDATATLDYGNGDCDKLATITINGVTKEIVIRK
jgi:outer membrane murein-binding lipoprotein Lpp